MLVYDVAPPPIVQLVGSVFPASPGPATAKLGFTLNKESASIVRRVSWTVPRAVVLRRRLSGIGSLTLRVGTKLAATTYAVTVKRGRFAFADADGDITTARAVVGRHRVALPIPAALQHPRHGVDAYLTNFELELAGTLRHCHHPHRYAVKVGLPKGSVSATATSPCQ